MKLGDWRVTLATRKAIRADSRVRLLLLRLPVARHLLGFRELSRSEFAADVVALLFRRTALIAGELCRGEVAPHVAQHRVGRHAFALEAQPAKVELRARVALIGRRLVPL